MGDSFEAKQVVLAVLRLLPNHRNALLTASRIFLNAGRYDKALELLRRGIAVYKNDPLFKTYQGDAYFKKEEFKSALKVNLVLLTFNSSESYRNHTNMFCYCCCCYTTIEKLFELFNGNNILTFHFGSFL